MNLFNLEGRKAIVTGASRGLGKAMARGLAQAGAQVAVLASSQSIYDAEKELREEGLSVKAYQVNLMDRNSVEETFRQILEFFGGNLDILVNNAGIQRRNPCEDFTMEDWDDVIQMNLTSVFQLCQLAGRVMLKQGKGKIINLASMLSYFGGFTVPAYAASKGGVAQLTKALSNEWSSKGINVNAIAPGYMNTEMNEKLIQDPGRNSEISARIPMHRWGEPEDMIGTVIFLASDASDYVTGITIPVDGGYLGR